MIRLINEDCSSLISQIVEGVEHPVIVTDPPFNIGYHYNSYRDKIDEKEYLDFIASFVNLCPCVIVHYPESLYKISFTAGVLPEKVVSWVYNSNTRKQHRDIAYFKIFPDFERVRQPYKNPKDKRIQERIKNGSKGGRLYDWWEINQIKNVSKEKTSHPCQMPLEVMKRVVGILPDGVTIIDPFMGSGTTGLACKELGIDFIGIEIDEEYYNIAKERILNDE